LSYKLNKEAMGMFSQVKHFISLGRYERARSIASDLITKYPEFPNVFYSMSVCEFNLGKIDNAIELCNKSLELGMSQLAVSIMLMCYYNEKDDFINVDRQFDLLGISGSTNADALGIYGYSLWRRGQHKKGIEILEEAFAKDATNYTIIDYLFTASKKSRKKDELKALLKIYMNSSASEKRKLIFAGKYALYEKNWKEAKRCFERVISIDPLDKVAVYYMSLVRFKCRDRYILWLTGIGFGLFAHALNAKNITGFTNLHRINEYLSYITALSLVTLPIVLEFRLRKF